MRTVSIFRNGKNTAIRLPKDMEFEGVTVLEISKNGETITLKPARPSWQSLVDVSLDEKDNSKGGNHDK